MDFLIGEYGEEYEKYISRGVALLAMERPRFASKQLAALNTPLAPYECPTDGAAW